jgi:hypothetical protein
MRTSAGQHLIVEKIYDKMMMRKLFSTARRAKYLKIYQEGSFHLQIGSAIIFCFAALG